MARAVKAAERHAHFVRVWHSIDTEAPLDVLVERFVASAVLDGRSPLNIVVQHDIDPASLIEQSCTELRDFADAVPAFIKEAENAGSATDELTAIFEKIGTFFRMLADDPDSREPMAHLWAQTIIPTIKRHLR
jgi:hypothetical protein